MAAELPASATGVFRLTLTCETQHNIYVNLFIPQ